ncbi:MAG TPA: DUF6599 family protein [Terriglobales bacterium]|jgi:hypothetical protein
MRIFHVIIVTLLSTLAQAAPSSNGPALLPNQFAGWQMQGETHTSADPAIADAVNAAVLKEYGFTDFASADYIRDDGRKIALKAARFVDASGAFGAFTFYRTPPMIAEEVGNDAASMNERVLFFRGNILVDAVFSRLNAMSAAELRTLASALPLPPGSNANLPTLPAYLPKESFIRNSARYILGPAALGKIDSPIPSDIVDFQAGAEVVLAKYSSSNGEGSVALIAYPTPQIASEHLRRIQAAQQQNGLSNVSEKRSGPILALTAGPFSNKESHSILEAVNYDADVTWSENTTANKKNNLANLLVNVIWLCVILVGLMLVAGVAFGGLRVLVRRLLPERIMARSEETDFISLHLSEDSTSRPLRS